MMRFSKKIMSVALAFLALQGVAKADDGLWNFYRVVCISALERDDKSEDFLQRMKSWRGVLLNNKTDNDYKAGFAIYFIDIDYKVTLIFDTRNNEKTCAMSIPVRQLKSLEATHEVFFKEGRIIKGLVHSEHSKLPSDTGRVIFNKIEYHLRSGVHEVEKKGDMEVYYLSLTKK